MQIPPVLLGLSVIVPSNSLEHTDSEVAGNIPIIDMQAMNMLENMLELSWELYYTSSAQSAASNINRWIQHLTGAAKEARGVQRDQLIAMLCKFYQLSGVAARDRMDIPRALRDGKKAIDLASQLRNPELISASLFRRAKTYLKQQDYDVALKDFEAALPYAEKSRDPLKGYVYQATAEAYSIVAKNDAQTQKQSLNLLDQVGRIVCKGNLEDDGSFVKLNIAGLYMDRAQALTLFHKTDEAHNALNIARNNLGPELTRWQARLLIADAEIYLAEDDPESCCEIAFDALKVVQATQSRSNEARVQKLSQQLGQRYQNHPLVKRLEMQLSQH